MKKAREEIREYDLRRKVGRAIGRYNLLEEGDRVLVAVSGGKDSLVLLDILHRLQRRAPVHYELVPFTLDPGFPGFDIDRIRAFTARLGMELVVESAPIAKVVEAKREELNTVCSLCARLRRGAIYGAAERLGCNKIALGHHADDVVETLLLGIFFTGEVKSMPPLLKAEDGRNIVIRPLCFVYESEIVRYLPNLEMDPVPMPCPETKITEKNRQWVKKLLLELEERIPEVKNSALAAAGNLREEFLLDPRFVGSPIRHRPKGEARRQKTYKSWLRDVRSMESPAAHPSEEDGPSGESS